MRENKMNFLTNAFFAFMWPDYLGSGGMDTRPRVDDLWWGNAFTDCIMVSVIVSNILANAL